MPDEVRARTVLFMPNMEKMETADRKSKSRTDPEHNLKNNTSVVHWSKEDLGDSGERSLCSLIKSFLHSGASQIPAELFEARISYFCIRFDHGV